MTEVSFKKIDWIMVDLFNKGQGNYFMMLVADTVSLN